jgi:FixJ family two-component response regulator
MPDIDDEDDFRTALADLLAEAEAAGVDTDTMTSLMTAHLTGLRGSVRLPLSMPPARAREFTDRAREHVGEPMEVELVVSEDVLAELELQLRVFEGGAAD